VAVNTVNSYLKENNVSDDIREKCVELLEQTLHVKKNTDYIYIHPKPTDNAMFFGDHFNLSAKKMTEIVRIGFRNTIDTLRRYEFD
jgi:hypothetical protein